MFVADFRDVLFVADFRDVSIHAASAEAKNVDGVVGLLADVVLRPLFTEDEVSGSSPEQNDPFLCM